METNVADLQNKIGYKFNDTALLYKALTHTSYTNENKMKKNDSNERLEFLGDAILELISSEYLFDNYPDMDEGYLTKLRAALVSEKPLSIVAKQIGLGNYIFLSKGEDLNGGRMRPSITSDAVEALLGAIYLDGGIDNARKFVYKYIVNDIENKELFVDSKTNLQELIQKYKLGELNYKMISESGPDHNKEYVYSCCIGDKEIGRGKGNTKKGAEQEAAYNAIISLKKKQK